MFNMNTNGPMLMPSLPLFIIFSCSGNYLQGLLKNLHPTTTHQKYIVKFVWRYQFIFNLDLTSLLTKQMLDLLAVDMEYPNKKKMKKMF